MIPKIIGTTTKKDTKDGTINCGFFPPSAPTNKDTTSVIIDTAISSDMYVTAMIADGIEAT